MRAPSPPYTHLKITQTLVRLYIFLAQILDRCVSDAARHTYPEHELRTQLGAARAEMMDILSVNRIVKDKVEQECERVNVLAAACRAEDAGTRKAREEAVVERGILKSKIMALTDVLAVFRAV